MGELKIWTVGHGTRPVEELAFLLETARIELLIDVRAHPGSRRHPQFNREPLESSLAAHRIGYRWEGKALGGFRKPRPDSANLALRNESFRGYADHMGSAEFTVAAGGLVGRAAPVALPSPAHLGLAGLARRRGRAFDRRAPQRAAYAYQGSGDRSGHGHLSGDDAARTETRDHLNFR